MSTNDFAIVVEYTRYWKLSFGLVLWYDFQSNQMSETILTINDSNDRKHGILLQTTIDHECMDDLIKVQFYLEDFGETYDKKEQLIKG